MTARTTTSSRLEKLIRAIASGDSARAFGMLETSPELAMEAASAGTSRQQAADFFLTGIARYLYAGDTALHIAAAAYRVDVARALTARGASPRARNRRGAEPLHAASSGGPGSKRWNPEAQTATIAFLIGSGADPNASDKSGVAPLHVAVRTRCAAAVRALIERGADPRRTNGNGSTPLHLAVQNTGRGGSGTAEAREQQAEIIRLLMERGARLTDRDGHGNSVESRVKGKWLEAVVRA
jgi:Ankyrin repeats (many copies)